MSKFTSGTWSVGISDKNNPYVYADDGGAIIAVIRDCGHISQSNAKDAVRLANARLMAAAPQMHELLKICAKTETPGNYIPAFLGLKDKARELLALIDGTEAPNEWTA